MNEINAQSNGEMHKPLKNFKVLKIVTAILFAVATVIAAIFMIDPVLNSDNANVGAAVSLIFLMPVSLLSYIPAFIASVIGLIRSIIGLIEKESSVWSLLYFIVFCLLPFVTLRLIIWVLTLIANA